MYKSKMLWFSFIVWCLVVGQSVGFCPSLCLCPQPGEALKLRCGGAPAQITELKEIDLSKVLAVVVSL